MYNSVQGQHHYLGLQHEIQRRAGANGNGVKRESVEYRRCGGLLQLCALFLDVSLLDTSQPRPGRQAGATGRGSALEATCGQRTLEDSRLTTQKTEKT